MPVTVLPTGERKKDIVRQQLWKILHHGHGLSGHAFNVALVMLIILSVGILPLEFMQSFAEFHGTLITVEIIVTALFTVEFGLRLYAAPNRWKYIFSLYGLIDIVSILPFYLGFLGTQYVRALRLVRLLKISEIEAAGTEEEEDTLEENVGLAPDERVEYIVSRHPLFLFVGCFPPAFSVTGALVVLFLLPGNPIAITISVSLILFALVFFWKTWLDYSYDLIYITSRRLIFQNQHLLGRSINQVNYFAITNVKPSYSSPIAYIFGYGSIVIDTPSAAVGHVELHMVRGHEKAAHLIMAKCTSHQDLQSIAPLTEDQEG